MLATFLIPLAPTDWTEAGRWQGNDDLPLSAHAEDIIRGWAEQVAAASHRLGGSVPTPVGFNRLLRQSVAGVTQHLSRLSSLLPSSSDSHPAQKALHPAHPTLSAVISSLNMTAMGTAEQLAADLGVSVRVDKDLDEVNLGFWQGLTTSQLTQKYERAFRRWQSDPSCVTPPNGECMMAATQRLGAVLERLTRKYARRQVAICAGPVTAALMRIAAGTAAWEDFWPMVTAAPTVQTLLLNESRQPARSAV